ncbi:hypothetical protein BIW11_00717, partial [Tropilaelaps mercedesae]
MIQHLIYDNIRCMNSHCRVHNLVCFFRKLPHFFTWKIASICADNLYQNANSDSQQINALNDAAKRELETVCRELGSNTSFIEECLVSGVASVTDGASLCSPSGISVKALRNARRTMEDRHVIIPDLNSVAPILKQATVCYEYYAVFDGHAGRDAANFGAAHLHIALADQLSCGCEPADAIRNAFYETDKNYCNSLSDSARRAGSTAVVALICDRRMLHIGWVGDSEAVLARAGTARHLVIPHKPSLQSEQARIEALGGVVHQIQGIHRVNGNLAVSRSIGDIEHKPYVSCEADVNSLDLDGECDFLVLGCDGLFDNLTPHDVVGHVYHAALSLQFDTTRVADQLTQAAVSNGSTDNITTLVVNLRDPKKWQYEAAVFLSQTQLSACPIGQGEYPAESKQQKCLNGNSAEPSSNAEILDLAPFTGGDASPVREVAADFVHSAVEMALNKVNNNGAPGGLELTSCDLSPPEGEQRDLIATLKNETPEAERLNPDAPEFVPFGRNVLPAGTSSLPSGADIPDLAQATPVLPANLSVAEAMSKSESRDELVYEIDRQLSTAPKPAKAEFVEIDDHTSPPQGAPFELSVAISCSADGTLPGEKQLSDSEEELNSMVVHENRPKADIRPSVNIDVKLKELIIRDQNIHVIPEESPSEDVASVPSQISDIPQQTSALASEFAGIKSPAEIAPESTIFVDFQNTSISKSASEIEQIADLAAGLASPIGTTEAPGSMELAKKEASFTDAASGIVADLSTQLIKGDFLNLIESSISQPTAACAASIASTVEPHTPAGTDYLFTMERTHEEAIVPRAQPLLYKNNQSIEVVEQPARLSVDNATLIDSMMSMTIDDGPKVVYAIEKEPTMILTPTCPQQALLVEESHGTEEVPKDSNECIDVMSTTPNPSEHRDAISSQPDSLKLGSIQDIMEKLSPSEAEEAKHDEIENHGTVPLIPDSVPEAEGVQDVDSESDNDVQEWEFVKGAAAKSERQGPVDDVSKAAFVDTAGAMPTVSTAAVATIVSGGVKSKSGSTKSAAKPGTKVISKSVAAFKPTSSGKLSTQSDVSTMASPPSKIVSKAPVAAKRTVGVSSEKAATAAAKPTGSRPTSSTTAKSAAIAGPNTLAAVVRTASVAHKTKSGITRAPAIKAVIPKTDTASVTTAPSKTTALKTTTMAKSVVTKSAPTTTGLAKSSPVRLAASRVTSAVSTKAQVTQPSKPLASSVRATTTTKVPATKTPVSTAMKSQAASARALAAKPTITAPASIATTKKSASSTAFVLGASRVAAARAAAAARSVPKFSTAPGIADAKPKSSTAIK